MSASRHPIHRVSLALAHSPSDAKDREAIESGTFAVDPGCAGQPAWSATVPSKAGKGSIVTTSSPNTCGMVLAKKATRPAASMPLNSVAAASKASHFVLGLQVHTATVRLAQTLALSLSLKLNISELERGRL